MVEIITTRAVLQIVVRGVVGEVTKMIIRDVYHGVKDVCRETKNRWDSQGEGDLIDLSDDLLYEYADNT